MTNSISRSTWDNVVIAVRDNGVESAWDGKVKMLAYDVSSMTWVAQDTTGAGIQTNSLVPYAYDYIGVTTNSTSDVFAYKSGGAAGTLVATVTVSYTDSTKNTLLSVVRT